MAMTESELKAILQSEERNALGYLGGALSEQRKKAMNYYLGEPFGNEVKDRSQVVSTDVADVIEWIVPAILKVFTGSDDVVECEPQKPEDEAVAKQASEYLNWIFIRDNPGFIVLHDAVKDALLNKTGIVKTWWDDTPQYQHQTYERLPEDSLNLLRQQEEAGEIVILSAEPVAADLMEEMGQQQPPEQPPTDPSLSVAGAGAEPPPPAPPPLLYDVEIRKTRLYGRARAMAVAPEEFLISRRARNVQDAHYVAHRSLRTQSSLIEDGYDKDIVETLVSEFEDRTGEQATRWQDIDEQRIGNPSDSTDRSTREVWVTESYILIDYDGDGIAERRKITHAGRGAVILTRNGKPDNEEWEGPVPFAVLTPVLMPHRLIGRSVADLVLDIQLIKSVVLRQALDNSYLANNVGFIFNPDAINVDDILVTRPGRNIRTTNGVAPEGQIVPIEYPQIAAQIFPLLEYMDDVRENRTGITKYNQGLDANSLNKTASGINQIMTASQQRIELIARVFAEGGVKQIFKNLLYLVCRHQDKPRVIRLRNQWVTMDPREWDEEMDIQINVGLGTGNRDQVLAHLAMLGQSQQLIVQAQGGLNGPIVTADNVANLARKQAENAGFKNPELFFSDPRNAPPQQPQPDPQMMKVQQDGQLQQAKMQQDAQLQQQKMQQDAQIAQGQAVQQSQTAQAQMMIDIEKMKQEGLIKQAQMVQDAQLQREQMERDHALRMAELSAEIQLKQQDMGARHALETQKMKSQVELESQRNANDNALKRELGEKSASQTPINVGPDPSMMIHGAVEKILAHVNTTHDGLRKEFVQHMALNAKPRKVNIIRGPDGRISGAEAVG